MKSEIQKLFVLNNKTITAERRFSKKITFCFAAILIVEVLVLASVFCLYNFSIMCYNNENYEEAKIYFSILDKIDYKNSRKFLAFCNYKIEKQILSSSDIGSEVEFGNYNGKPITWIVCKKNKHELVLLSKDILCSYDYDDDFYYNLCSNKNLYNNLGITKYLNNEFYNEAFSDEEKSIIIKKSRNSKYVCGCGTTGTKTIKEYVTIPTVKFVDNNVPKEYLGFNFLNNSYSGNDLYLTRNQHCIYLLCVDNKGKCYQSYSRNVGLRPVINVKI